MITASEALDLIAEAPGGGAKTAGELWDASVECERQAERKTRIALARQDGNRRRARAIAAQQEAGKLRAYAQITAVAAAEVERRKCRTVGEARRSAFTRMLRRAFSRTP